MEYFKIIVLAVFVNNIVLVQFLGLCPCFGTGNRIKTAAGMGLAITIVITLANILTYFLDHLILLPLKMEFLKTFTFILVIACLVQIIEIITRKISPIFFKSIGIYLILITTNCAVLGTILLAIPEKLYFSSKYNFFFFIFTWIYTGTDIDGRY